MINLKLQETIKIPVDSIKLEGDLIIPDKAKSIIVFSHGSGSGRNSPRNKFVASKLQEENFATLMFDLLTPEEDQDYHKRFDIELLTQRLIMVTGWLKEEAVTKDLRIGYFGASTGAASALGAAAMLGDFVKAIVSRGGRPDLAMPYLQEVKAPTLLIVGSLDHHVIQLNQEAFALLKPQKELLIIQEASHLFEEPGKLEEVADHAIHWFHKYLDGNKDF